MLVNHKQAYDTGYRYLRSLVDPLDESQLLATCPHCPEWSLKDVLAHLVSVFEVTEAQWKPEWLRKRIIDSLVNPDPSERQAAGLDRDKFWNDLVTSLQPLSVTELFDRWEAAMDRLPTDQWNVVDFAVHVGDIEEALGTTGSREMDMHALGLERYGELLVGHLDASGVPTVSLLGTDPTFTAGDESASHQVRGSTYEILRAVTGRRTLAEAEELLDWTTTPDRSKVELAIYDWLPQSLRGTTIS